MKSLFFNYYHFKRCYWNNCNWKLLYEI